MNPMHKKYIIESFNNGLDQEEEGSFELETDLLK
jgi:hypothetical protein